MEEVEIWKSIDGFPGYLVSSFGRVWSFKSHRFIFSNSKYWNASYSLVTLKGKDIERVTGIHVLVAEAFIPNPERKPQVNHKDGFKHNNHVSNLEWVTRSENLIHCWKYLHRDRYMPKPQVIERDSYDEIKAFYKAEWEKFKQTLRRPEEERKMKSKFHRIKYKKRILYETKKEDKK